MQEKFKKEKEVKRKEYNLIRCSTPSQTHKEIKSSVKIALKILLKEINITKKYIGIYWPLKGETDIRFLKYSDGHNVALPSSSIQHGINYHEWTNKQLKPDLNNIPAPLQEMPLDPKDLSLLLVPAISIDCEGYRLGYGGGYFDRLREKKTWNTIPSFVIINHSCISKKPLPRDSWDIPFNGWISENGLHQIKN